MKDSDLWQTPIEVFKALNAEFNFDFDVCQNGINGLAPYLGDYFTSDYENCTCFMNPPFSNSKPFVERAIELRDRKVTTVIILKADTSTKLFGLLYNYEKKKPHKGVEIRFLPKRIQYIHPNKKSSSANFPSMFVILRGYK